MKRFLVFLAIAIMASPCYATLIHHYNFTTNVSDLVGGANGTLLNGANISGGVLNLDGSNDYVQFDSHIMPTAGSYTVALFAKQDSPQSTYVKLISQGNSGGPGFYIGHDPYGTIRASDLWTYTGIAFPSDGQFHHFALVVMAGLQSLLCVDDMLQATLGFAITSVSWGSHTCLGKQFSPYDEYFDDALDDVRIYDSALSGTEISAMTSVPEPTTLTLLGLGLAGISFSRRKLAA